MKYSFKYSVKQSGNILFIIFLAVGLFAALSYALTLSGRVGGGALNEQNKLNASEIIAYGTDLRQAVSRLELTHNCTDSMISFENSTVAGYTNALAPADNSCNVFDSAGGKMAYVVPNELWMDTAQSAQPLYREIYFSPSSCVEDVGGSDTAGNTAGGAQDCSQDTKANNELIMFIPYITKETCIAINRTAGITNPGNVPPQNSDRAWPDADPKWEGTFDEDINRVDPTEILGHYNGCFEGTTHPAAGIYTYYHVLKAR